jgi:hypothetical protein
MVTWSAHLLRVREVAGSNIGQQTCYSGWSFSGFPRYIPLIPSTFFVTHNSQIVLPWHSCYEMIIWRDTHWECQAMQTKRGLVRMSWREEPALGPHVWTSFTRASSEGIVTTLQGRHLTVAPLSEQRGGSCVTAPRWTLISPAGRFSGDEEGWIWGAYPHPNHKATPHPSHKSLETRPVAQLTRTTEQLSHTQLHSKSATSPMLRRTYRNLATQVHFPLMELRYPEMISLSLLHQFLTVFSLSTPHIIPENLKGKGHLGGLCMDRREIGKW